MWFFFIFGRFLQLYLFSKAKNYSLSNITVVRPRSNIFLMYGTKRAKIIADRKLFYERYSIVKSIVNNSMILLTSFLTVTVICNFCGPLSGSIIDSRARLGCCMILKLKSLNLWPKVCVVGLLKNIFINSLHSNSSWISEYSNVKTKRKFESIWEDVVQNNAALGNFHFGRQRDVLEWQIFRLGQAA